MHVRIRQVRDRGPANTGAHEHTLKVIEGPIRIDSDYALARLATRLQPFTPITANLIVFIVFTAL